jgi:hypothetical protein
MQYIIFLTRLTWTEPYLVLLRLLSQDTKLKDFLSHHEKKTKKIESASTSSSHTKAVEGITTEDIPQVPLIVYNIFNHFQYLSLKHKNYLTLFIGLQQISSSCRTS